MKLFKRKHFQSLIYSIFLALPLLSVVGRTVYTVANKNAKDSYYGETINEVSYSPSTLNTMVLGSRYLFQNDDFFTFANTGGVTYISVSNVVDNSTNSVIQADTIRIYSNVYNNTGHMYFIPTLNGVGVRNYDLMLQKVSFTFDYGGVSISSTITNLDQFNDSLFSLSYNKYSYLDNAFEYSIDRFVSENDYGNLDFFSWFSSLFLSSNSLNSLYIHFINWYMNYILYVSLGYLIFSVLLWFVNFFRKLVDNTQNINVGGL